MNHFVKKTIIAFFLIWVFGVGNQSANSIEIRGNFSGQGRLFLNDPLFDEQQRDTISLSGQSEMYHEWNNFSLTLTPFFRLDIADKERTHVDIRELKYLQFGENWEFEIGLGKVFWGVSESQHLVDIVNQTDQVESSDGEKKLGQPMAHLSLPLEYGTFDFFILPYFRERTFPGKKGRLRSSLLIDTDRSSYESADKQRHIDIAFRYGHTIGDVDMGLSYFIGTGRNPAFTVGTNDSNQPTLLPYYEQISQTGIELQWIYESWIYKFEGIHRMGQQNRAGKDQGYVALTAGFEYTFSGLSSGIDIGTLAEWLHDTRSDDATTPFENDIMVGIRVAVNDIKGTEFLFGAIHDLQSSSKYITFEGSRRITDFLKFSLESNIIIENSPNEVLYDFRKDDLLQGELTYYF